MTHGPVPDHGMGVGDLCTRKCTYYAGLQVSGEELNTYENGKNMEVMPT